MKNFIYAIFLFSVVVQGCGDNFLDVKRNVNQVVPSSVKDYKALLSRNNLLITSNDLAFLGADEYYIPSQANLVAGSVFTPFHKNAYIWADDVYEGGEVRDWNEAYEKIMYANLALDMEKIVPNKSETEAWMATRIAARFHRAWNFYQLAQLFCVPYDESTAEEELGVPLRLDYDVSLKYDRSSLKDVYDQILKDLHDAEKIGMAGEENIYFPGYLAVQALLARTYLQMSASPEALVHAEKALELKSELLDFNDLSGDITNVYSSYFSTFGRNNPSIIFYSYRAVGGIMGATRINVDTVFLSNLEEHDLRKKMFFKRPNGTSVYIGSYSGGGANNPFTGLSVEEALLTSAECHARSGRDDEAIRLVNLLRKNRFDRDHFVELKESDIADCLAVVLEERKKELFLRGTRWEDLRRLKIDNDYAQPVTRILDGLKFELTPNSKKWVWQVPQKELEISGLKPNDR